MQAYTRQFPRSNIPESAIGRPAFRNSDTRADRGYKRPPLHDRGGPLWPSVNTGDRARLGVGAGRYSFAVVDLHLLLLAGFTGAPDFLIFCTTVVLGAVPGVGVVVKLTFSTSRIVDLGREQQNIRRTGI